MPHQLTKCIDPARCCSLFNNNLGADGAKFLSEALKQDTGLKRLKYAATRTSLRQFPNPVNVSHC